MHEIGDAMTERTLATAAGWLGFGVASLPVLDIVDRSGLLTLLTSPQTLELGMLVGPLLKIAFFVAVGIAITALLPRHGPRGRSWFFAGCVLPVVGYGLATGLRLSLVVSLVAVCFAFVQLRLAHDAASPH